MAQILPQKVTNPNNILNENENPSRVFHHFRFCTKPFNRFNQYPPHHEGFKHSSILDIICIKWTIMEYLHESTLETPKYGDMRRTIGSKIQLKFGRLNGYVNSHLSCINHCTYLCPIDEVNKLWKLRNHHQDV